MTSDVAFLHWFTGLLDGEGCFFAQFYPAPSGALPLTLRAEIALRRDDLPLLEEVQRRVGGSISLCPARRPTWAPTAVWRVSGKQECGELLDKLEGYALRSKKAQDFETWKRIVATYARFKRGGRNARAHNAPMIAEIEGLIQQLQEGRSYSHH